MVTGRKHMVEGKMEFGWQTQKRWAESLEALWNRLRSPSGGSEDWRGVLRNQEEVWHHTDFDCWINYGIGLLLQVELAR